MAGLSPRTWMIGALIALVGLGGCAVAVARGGGVREHVRDTYRAAGTERAPNGARTLVFLSDKRPTAVADEIIGARKPADKRATPAGVFLRYSSDVISIVPQGRGSKILVDDDDAGYVRAYPYVGGFWGTYSGPAESFRGGGPGVGK